MSSTMEIKQHNLDCIREVIQTEGPCTKAGLSRRTNLSLATCNNLLNEMLENAELVQVDQMESQGGRPAQQYVYNKNYLHVLCVYLIIEHEMRNVGVTIANALGEIVSQSVLHPDWINYEYLVDLLDGLIASDPLIRVVSIGVPGAVENGALETCDIHSLEGLNLQAMLAEHLQVKVIVDNDMSFIAYGSCWMTEKKANSFAVIGFSNDECCGAGIVINGKIYKGFRRFAGELSYALAESSVPRDRQAPSKLDKPTFLKLVSKAILMTVCVLSPEHIVLMADYLNEEDVQGIIAYCSEFVGEHFIPPIELSRNFYPFWVTGMIRVALNAQKGSYPHLIEEA